MGRIPMGAVPKTERMVVLVTPQHKKDFGKLAVMQRKSLNAFVNDVLIDYLTNHLDDVEKYNNVFGADNLPE